MVRLAKWKVAQGLCSCRAVQPPPSSYGTKAIPPPAQRGPGRRAGPARAPRCPAPPRAAGTRAPGPPRGQARLRAPARLLRPRRGPGAASAQRPSGSGCAEPPRQGGHCSGTRGWAGLGWKGPGAVLPPGRGGSGGQAAGRLCRGRRRGEGPGAARGEQRRAACRGRPGPQGLLACSRPLPRGKARGERPHGRGTLSAVPAASLRFQPWAFASGRLEGSARERHLCSAASPVLHCRHGISARAHPSLEAPPQ